MKIVSVKEDAIKLQGPTALLFYVGDVQKHNFRNFELRLNLKPILEFIFTQKTKKMDGFPMTIRFRSIIHMRIGSEQGICMVS